MASGLSKWCTFKNLGEKCGALAVPATTRCPTHTTAKCTAKSSRTGKPCAQYPTPGATVCRFHGGAAPQVQRKARERAATSMDALRSAVVVAEDAKPELDEVAELQKLLRMVIEGVSRVQKEMNVKGNTTASVHGWSVSLEKWTARAESISVNLRKMRLDARFRKLAEDLVSAMVEWVLRYVPEHRREAAANDLRRIAVELVTDIERREGTK